MKHGMMKSSRYLFMIAASAAIILATSCSSEQDEVEASLQGNVEIRLSTSVKGMVITRAATDIQSEQFDYVAAQGEPGQEGYVAAVPELINVEIIDAKVKADDTPAAKPATPIRASYIFATTNTTGGLTPTGTTPYFPNTGNKVNIYAYYPSTFGTTSASSAYTWSGETPATTFTIATDQSTAAGYKASDLMYGVPASNPVGRTNSAIPLTFTHKLAKVIVRIKGDGNGLATSGLSDATVSMKAMASASVDNTATATPATWSSETAAAISMGAGTATTIETVDYYETAAIVVPQTIAANSANVITITLPDGGVYNYTPTNALTLETGKVHVFTITLGLHGISVTTSITNWGAGAGDTQTMVL